MSVSIKICFTIIEKFINRCNLIITEVDSKIYDELMKNDWDLLIAHYLGVDHAGHRYGPNHPEMTRKLDETNARLEKIINLIPDDVLLYVVGDHGMTENGKKAYFRMIFTIVNSCTPFT